MRTAARKAPYASFLLQLVGDMLTQCGFKRCGKPYKDYTESWKHFRMMAAPDEQCAALPDEAVPPPPQTREREGRRARGSRYQQ